MRIIDLYTLPIMHSKLELDKNYQREMNNFIKEETSKPGAVRSNVNGYQSEDLDPLNNTFLNLLKDSFEEKANVFSQEVMKINKTLSFGNMWLNVNGYKDYNHLHVHPKAIVSGSFYCKVPEKSGPLRFLVNKDIPLFVSDEYIDTFNKYNSSWFDIFPTEFDTLFFPSWIQHEVRPNMNKKEKRITISFNFS